MQTCGGEGEGGTHQSCQLHIPDNSQQLLNIWRMTNTHSGWARTSFDVCSHFWHKAMAARVGSLTQTLVSEWFLESHQVEVLIRLWFQRNQSVTLGSGGAGKNSKLTQKHHTKTQTFLYSSALPWGQLHFHPFSTLWGPTPVTSQRPPRGPTPRPQQSRGTRRMLQSQSHILQLSLAM